MTERGPGSIVAQMAGRVVADEHLRGNEDGFVVAASTPPALYSDDRGVIVAMRGKPRIARSPPGLEAAPDGALRHFVDLYREHGVDALKSLYGAFCIALIDEPGETLLLAIDRLGIESLFFCPVPGGIAFASSVNTLVRHPAIPSRISAQGLFDYMYFHVVPSPIAIIENVTRLKPGECVVSARGRLEQRRYWQPRFEERDRRPFATLKEEFVQALRASVLDAAAGDRVATFLSGGTDSSTITGMLARELARQTDAYSIGFEAEGYDEMSYARIAAQHFGVRHHEYYVTPDDIVAAVPRLATIFDQPFGNSSVVPTYYCAQRAADDGVKRMIAGDGGDELFGGNARYATQYVFSLYETVPHPLRQWLIEPVARRLPLNVTATRKVRRYVEQASIPMPARTETYNLLQWFGYEQVFAPDVLRRIDAQQPLALQREAYFNPSAHSLINRQLALDLKFTLADNDLPKVIRACELAGVPVSFPMLDERVVDFALRLHPRLKLRGAKLRYFFKEALRDFLPEAIIAKQKHGFGLPFGPWVVRHPRLRALAFDSLSDLKRRHLFNPALIDRLPERLNEHPAYYGTMVWVLMMLEQWFALHAPAVDGRSL